MPMPPIITRALSNSTQAAHHVVGSIAVHVDALAVLLGYLHGAGSASTGPGCVCAAAQKLAAGGPAHTCPHAARAEFCRFAPCPRSETRASIAGYELAGRRHRLRQASSPTMMISCRRVLINIVRTAAQRALADTSLALVRVLTAELSTRAHRLDRGSDCFGSRPSSRGRSGKALDRS